MEFHLLVLGQGSVARHLTRYGEKMTSVKFSGRGILILSLVHGPAFF